MGMGRFAGVITLAAAVLASAAPTAAAEGTSLPVGLTFSSDAGGVRDGAGIGTGFGFVLPGAGGAAYRPDLLHVDRPAGLLRVGTTAGIAYRAENNLDNALGLDLAGGGSAVTLRAALADVRALDQPGTYQQAGLWVGPSQDTYVKLVVISAPSSQRVHALYEADGVVVGSLYGPSLDLTGRAVELRLRVVPATGNVTAAYSIDGAPGVPLGAFGVAPSLMNEDGFRAGISATHRRATAPVRFDFQRFAAACSASRCAAIPPPDPDLGDGTSPVGLSGGPGGEEPPAGTAHGAPVDPGKLEATFRAARRIRWSALQRGIPIAVRCTLACRYELRLKLPRSSARKLGLKPGRRARTVGHTISVAPAGSTTKSVLRLGRKQRSRLRQPRGRVGLKLSLVATAGPSGWVRAHRRLALRP